MPVIVNQVPANTRKPGHYLHVNTQGAKTGLPVTADKVLIIAHQSSTATATTAVPVQVYSAAEARSLFGNGSPAALMVAALLKANPYVAAIWVCPLDEDGSAVQASGTLTVTASSQEPGILTVSIGHHAVTIGVDASDTQNDIAAALEAAIDNDTSLPFTASVSTNVVTITAVVGGTHGNDWEVETEYSTSGVSVAVVQPASGATDADIQDALDAVVSSQYDIVVTEFNDTTSLGALKTHLDTVSGALEQRPGVGIAGMSGTLSTVTTATSGINSGRIWVPYLRGSLSHPMEYAAACAGALSAEGDKARPLNRVVLNGIVPPSSPSDYLTRAEQESCLANGASPLQVGPGSTVQIVRSVTTYVQDAFSADDDTLLDLQTIRVLDYTRFAVRTKLQAQLAQVKVADVAKGPNTTDPAKIRSLILGVLLQLETQLGYLEKVEDHADQLVVERDGSNVNRVNASIPADIVDGLHVFAGSINLILG